LILRHPTTDELDKLLRSLENQFPIINFRGFLTDYEVLLNKRNEFFILEQIIYEEYKKLKNIENSLRSIGIYFGRMRKEFGLALEALDLLVQKISRDALAKSSIKLNSSQSKTFLYGKQVTKKKFSNKELYSRENIMKRFVLDEHGDVIGIGVIKRRDDSILIDPIVDLGQYLRSEDSGMFHH
jgi:ribosome biogenesis protein Nip4